MEYKLIIQQKMKFTPIFYLRVKGEIIAQGTTQQVIMNQALDLVDEGIDPKHIKINGRSLEFYL